MASAAGHDESQTEESHAQDKLASCGAADRESGHGHAVPRKRAAELRERIEKANHEYHVFDQPIDQAYDALMREIQDLEAKHPELVTPDSPTTRVGAPASNRFAPIEHAHRILSQSNAFDEAELRAFDQRARKGLGREDVGEVCELKIDGLAINLPYQDGRFVQGRRAATARLVRT